MIRSEGDCLVLVPPELKFCWRMRKKVRVRVEKGVMRGVVRVRVIVWMLQVGMEE
jgi:hypothetical protein